MIISYKRQFVFIHVYKTGGDSVATALAPVLGRRDVALTTDLQQWFQRVIPGPRRRAATRLGKHSPAIAVRQFLSPDQWGQYYTFAFVRSPVSRAVSLYSFARKKAEERRRVLPRNLWYMLPTGRATDPLKWPSVQAYLETSCFSEFLRHPLVMTAPAMQPQWQAICDESRKPLVNFIGRFERLAEDFDLVQSKLSLMPTALPWRNSSNPRITERRPTLTDDDLNLLGQKYAEDFAMFGYDLTNDF